MNASIKDLIQAGVHFGHEKRKWDPKMAPYILGEKNGVYIIDLRKTMDGLNRSCDFLGEIGRAGKGVLFVGTKKQAQRAVTDAAKKCGMYFVRQRWLGGTLTNFVTVKKSIDRLNDLERQRESGEMDRHSKKELSRFNREHKRLEKSLGGIRNMKELPGAVVVIDTEREKIAVLEANRLGIPVVGIVDTKCNPDPIDFVIPANDDAIKTAKLLFEVLSDAVWEGKNQAMKEAGIPVEERQEVQPDQADDAVPEEAEDERAVVVKSANDSAEGGEPEVAEKEQAAEAEWE